MNNCMAKGLGCGCQDKCRADIIPTEPRKVSFTAHMITALIVGVLVAGAAYVGLSEAEKSYQSDARV